MKVLLIDNYDSFIYNLCYELNSLGLEVTVCRNDIEYNQLKSMVNKHDAIIVSPGPSDPKSAGHCIQLIKDFYQSKPILGICLGHQAIAEALGGIVGRAKQIIHGKNSKVILHTSALFNGLDNQLSVARYHSLIVRQLPRGFNIIAKSDANEIMAIEHLKYPVYGLQFHPESLMTFKGNQIINNFKDIMSSTISCQEAKYVANA